MRSARLQVELLEGRTVPSINMVELEPNNTMAAAQSLPRVPEIDVIVDGDISSGDRDWFRVDLQAGDVIGAALAGQSGLNPALRLVDSAGQLLVSNDDSFFTGGQLLPPESPLPYDESHVQNSEVYYVISTPGTYLIEVAASGDASAGKYKLDLVVARPGLEKEPVGTRQILFLDFDGATVNFSQFAGDEVTGTKRLAPLSSFLTDWGLTPADESAVIDGVVAKVMAKLSAYVRANGLNGDFAATGIPGQFAIDIRSSRDHPDEFGKNRFMSRVVVGGTEAQVGHAGLAQYIDVGNFKTDDEAVATLDRFTRGLARIPIQPPATPLDFLTEGIATLVAHEAGHLFGCFHTDQLQTDIFAGTPNLMDPNFSAHVGPDNIFGTADDVDLQLGVDSYRLADVFRGINDTLNTVSFGLSTGKQAATLTSSASAASAEKPNGSQTTPFIFTFAFSAVYDQAVTLSNRTIAGTAGASDGKDDVAKTGTLTFKTGETTKTITVEVKDDSKWEANETFSLDLFGNSSNLLFTNNRGIGTILNDD